MQPPKITLKLQAYPFHGQLHTCLHRMPAAEVKGAYILQALYLELLALTENSPERLRLPFSQALALAFFVQVTDKGEYGRFCAAFIRESIEQARRKHNRKAFGLA